MEMKDHSEYILFEILILTHLNTTINFMSNWCLEISFITLETKIKVKMLAGPNM